VHAYAAVERGDVAFDRRAHAKRDHRHTREMTQADDRRDFLVGFGEYDHVGQRYIDESLPMAVMLAYRLGGDGAFAIIAAELLHAHTVLAGDRPADVDAELEHFGAEGLRLLGIAGTVRVVENQRMQIAVARMENVHARQTELGGELADALQNWSERPSRDRAVHAVVGGRDTSGS